MATDETQNKRLYLFGTCLIDVYHPEVGIDAIDLLEACGYEVLFLQDQTCCGQPAFNSGFEEASLPVARHQLRLFGSLMDETPLVLPSASCTGMIIRNYPELFKGEREYEAMAASLSKRTYELLDFLNQHLDLSPLEQVPPIKVALHRSCASTREINVSESWLSLLKRAPNIEVVEPENAFECCGFGGTFSVKSSAISAKMTKDKTDALLATNAPYIASGDMGCLLNISAHLQHRNHHQRRKSSPQIIHVASLINQQLKISRKLKQDHVVF